MNNLFYKLTVKYFPFINHVPELVFTTNRHQNVIQFYKIPKKNQINVTF
jgi:hypothetical protein